MIRKGNQSYRKFSSFVIAVTIYLIVAVVLGVFYSSVEAKELKVIPLRLSWFKHIMPHSFFFLAEDKGYYADEGIKLDVFEGKGSGLTVKVVAGSAGSIFGFAGYETMASAVNNGVPIKGVFNLYQHSPMAIMSHAENPIQTGKDLIGKRFAVMAQSNVETMFHAVLSAQKINENQVKIVHAPLDMANTLFLQRKVDALLSVFPTAVPLLKSKGAKVHYIKYADLGINVPMHGLITNLTTLREQPDLVGGFLRATAKAVRDGRVNPKEAIAALVRHAPKAKGKEEMLFENMLMSLECYYTPETKYKPIGWLDPGQWQKTLDLLIKLGRIDKKLPLESYHSNEFLSEILWQW